MKRSEEIYSAIVEKQAQAYSITRDLETLVTMYNEAKLCEARQEEEAQKEPDGGDSL